MTCKVVAQLTKYTVMGSLYGLLVTAKTDTPSLAQDRTTHR